MGPAWKVSKKEELMNQHENTSLEKIQEIQIIPVGSAAESKRPTQNSKTPHLVIIDNRFDGQHKKK